jgi:superfamily II DNA or RNA helicase
MGLYKAAHEGLATLIVSPQAAHLDNWLSEMQQFFDLDSEPGRVGDGKMEYDREVVLCTVQTLATRAEDGKLPIDFAHRFGTIIFDECHHMSAEWFARSIDLCIGNRYGLTATPKRTDRNEGVFLSHIGPIVYSDDTQEMIPEIEVIELDTELTDADEKLIQDRSKQRNLAMLKSWLAQNTERNAAISRRLTKAVAEGRTIYALSHSVEHVKTLSAMFPGSGLITGETPSEDRLKELNKSKIVFATFGVATENYNRKDLDCLFMLTPLAADGYAEAPQLRQAIGRVQRAAQGKKTPEVIIFLDRNIDECRGLTYSVLNYLKSKNYPFRNSTWNQKRRNPMGRT